MKIILTASSQAELGPAQKKAIEKILKAPVQIAYQLEKEDFDIDVQFKLDIEEEARGWSE